MGWAGVLGLPRGPKCDKKWISMIQIIIPSKSALLALIVCKTCSCISIYACILLHECLRLDIWVCLPHADYTVLHFNLQWVHIIHECHLQSHIVSYLHQHL